MRPLFVFVAALRRHAVTVMPLATLAITVIAKGHRWA